MQRFKNILLLLNEDTDDRAAIERAGGLARRNEARLTVLSTVEAAPTRLRLDRASEIADRVAGEARRAAEAVATSLCESGLDAAPVVVTGKRFLEVIRRVLRERHDLVVMTADGQGLRDRLLGSTARHLMRKCPCPVWATKPNAAAPYPRVLAAVDPDPSDESELALSRKVLTLASSLARLERSELHIVHAWSLFGESLLRRHDDRREVDAMADRARATHEEQLATLLHGFTLDDLEHQVHLLKGDPGPTIAEVTTTLAPDLVVIGTVGRTRLAGFFIGNTAEAVLDRVDCSVLAVKPDGFVTPVAP
jgi:nucleotide-binding universal stress UspA family protein